MVTPVDETSLPERILDAAEGVLRRYGADKTNVVDIAKSLGMSHGNIYRHFPSKKAILNAVAGRWLQVLMKPLEAIAADSDRPAAERLKAWFDCLRAAKRRKLRDDPELFLMHQYIVENEREMVAQHLAALHGLVQRIMADGIAAGEFRPELDPADAARAFLLGTVAFHHPVLVMQNPPTTDHDAELVFDLVLAGLRAQFA
ncbi:MAG: TetR/AcrR family transcriptional regulator [Phycisphaerales bacterium]|nr:TetR/AcrR family transcriptional regulator [Phycisphaerales bacterium]